MMSRKLSRNHHRMAAPNHEGNWAVSYVDMITLLLCFFIIFFNSDKIKTKVKPDPVQKIAADLSHHQNPNEGTSGKLNIAQGVDAPGAKLAQVLKAMKADGQMLMKSEMKGNALEIAFDHVSFFESGQTKLTKEGQGVVDQVITMLTPYKNDVRVTVQGYTDSRNVVFNKRRVSDNWELSVIRATSVLKVFNHEGFPQEHLSAEGFADTRVERTVASDLAHQRKITLRVEELNQ